MSQLTQSLQQRLSQRLSPQQIQGIKLLELPTLMLEARIKQEIEENPALDEMEKQNDENDTRTTIEDYMRAEETAASYKLRANNYSADDERRQKTLSDGKSLSEFLAEQLAYFDLTDKQRHISAFIVGTLDDDGYLRRDNISLTDDLAFTQGIEASEAEIEAVIREVQKCDPSGIAARNLPECLEIQLRQLRRQTPATRHAYRILHEFFDSFLKKHYDKIRQKLGITQDELRDAIGEIMSLNPKPANGYADESVSTAPVVTPDFVLDYNAPEDTFDLQMASRNIPELKINRSYLNMAEKALASGGNTSESDKDALTFVRQKIDSARWFIAAIKQRQQTLSKTMRAILDFQREYFKEGDPAKLRPMILRDIAERSGFDISTISRVVNSKYIQTHFGMFLLKYFFSEGLSTDSGEEVSTREIKRILKECVDNESQGDPLTDEALMESLHAKGYKIARRTVAKYREQLGVPVARLRKQL